MNKALEILRNGGVILYPTDTVWGIGCDATNPEAVAKVYAIKKREDSKSLVLLASDMDMICRYVKEIPEMAVQLVEVNDKPMTIIYPGAVAGEKGCMRAERSCLAFNTVAEDGTVGIRVPMMDFCQQLVSKLGRPIVSTSANISGEATPKRFAEISEEIKAAVDYIAPKSLGRDSSGKASQIIKIGLGGEVEIIRA
jgi:L-threonylcarbamoyladenylate synthase